MQKQTQHKENHKGLNNAAAGMMGAAVGGIVGAAAGIALSDRQKRQMIVNKMDELKSYVTKALDEISQMSEGLGDGVNEATIVPKAKKTRAKKKQVN
jgi:hypothetical protein